MIARDVTGFHTSFSIRKSGNFLHILGRFHDQLGEKEKDPPNFKKKISGNGAPKLQISVPGRGQTCPDKLAPNLGHESHGNHEMKFRKQPPFKKLQFQYLRKPHTGEIKVSTSTLAALFSKMTLTGERIAMVDMVLLVFPAFPYLP